MNGYEFNLPSDEYIQIVAAGLKETLKWTKEEIADYLIRKQGIRDTVDKKILIRKLGM